MEMPVIKIAVRTAGRTGFSAALFFLLGLYLIFPAASSFYQLREDKNEAFEIRATASSTVDLMELGDIEGVKALSPVISLNGKIISGEYALETELEGVLGSYLDERKIAGRAFPAGANMPCLIFNEAAQRAFRDSEGNTIEKIDPGGEFILSVDSGMAAVLCGILNDGEETPRVYMNYDFAKNLAGYQEHYEIRFRLISAGYGNEVTRALKAYGLELQSEYGRIEQWEAMERGIMLQCLSSLGFLICAVLLAQKNCALEMCRGSEELRSLRLSGLSLRELYCILILRLAITLLRSLLLAGVAAWWSLNMSGPALLAAAGASLCCVLLFALLIKKAFPAD